MCGLAGLVDLSGGPIDRALLKRMNDRLAHRGPDGEGFWFGEGVGLGHRRLAVIDLSRAADQPMGSPDGAVQLVFNGEIYNFREVRRALEQRGLVFQSQGDSEVILNGYLAWGDEVLSHLEGMFAFVIWDARRRHVLAARDRMGKKPLYYAEIPRPGEAPLFAFASELKALLALPELDRAVDPEALASYLVYEYVPAPRTIVKGARKLDAAECLTLDDVGPGSKVEVRRYWKLPIPSSHPRMDLEEAKTELRRRLGQAVKRRLVADVPLGVFLSGGIDSSTVLALMADQAGASRINTFSVGFAAEDASFDESGYARLVSSRFGTQHHEERLDARAMLDVLPAVMSFLDEPLADASVVPTYLLSRFTRRHVTVALGGDGGDELFAGYPTFRAERMARAWIDPLPPRVRRAGQRMAEHLLRHLPARSDYFSWDFKLAQFVRGFGHQGPQRHQRWLASFVPEELPSLFARGFAWSGRDPLEGLSRGASSSFEHAPDPWDDLLAFYCRGYLAGDINVKVDRASSAVSLEARAPFLDTDVVAFACALPPEMRLRGQTTKFVLKEAMRGVLPDEVLDRPKQGFGVPVARWLRTDLRPWMADLLSPARLRRQGIFDETTVVRLMEDHVQGRRDRRKQLWTLLVFQSWLDHWSATKP